MKQHRTRLFLLTALALMTNGLSLLGFSHGSVGAVAKTIECNHNIGRGILTERALKSLSGNPPSGRQPLPRLFDLGSIAGFHGRLA